MRRLAIICAVLAIAVVPARAQRRDDVRTLAIVCASETGFDGSAEECAAIHGVLSRRADRVGMTFSAFARVYSDRAFDADRRDARAYLPHLRLDGREPMRWPTTSMIAPEGLGPSRVRPHPSWSAYRARWLRLVEGARAVLRGDVEDPCRADHWGGAMDDHRAERAGWVRAECAVETANHFWRVPRREEG